MDVQIRDLRSKSDRTIVGFLSGVSCGQSLVLGVCAWRMSCVGRGGRGMSNETHVVVNVY